jgi:hypothetical protein
LVWSGLLPLLPRLPALGVRRLLLNPLCGDTLLAALLRTGLYGLPPACLRALRPWSLPLRARFPPTWSGWWCSGGRERLGGVGMRRKRLRVAGGALWAGCPTDITCEVIIAHGALFRVVDGGIEGFHGAGLGVGAQRRTGAEWVAPPRNCAGG